MLDVIGDVPEIRYGKDRYADDIFIMHGRTVRGVVGVPLGAEAEDGAVLLVGQDLNDPVGGHGILIEHEGDGIPHLKVLGVHALDIEQGAGVISRLHRAGKDDICIQPHQPDAHQGHGQQHHQHHQHRADYIPNFFQRMTHYNMYSRGLFCVGRTAQP